MMYEQGPAHVRAVHKFENICEMVSQCNRQCRERSAQRTETMTAAIRSCDRFAREYSWRSIGEDRHWNTNATVVHIVLRTSVCACAVNNVVIYITTEATYK